MSLSTVKMSTNKRSDVLKDTSKLDKSNAVNYIKSLLGTACNSKDLTIQDKHALRLATKLALKIVQDNINHEGRDHFKDITYYDAIFNKKCGTTGQKVLDVKCAQEFFEELMNNCKDQLETICVHRRSVCGDRKYSFFGTNYTNSALDIRRYLDNNDEILENNTKNNQSTIQISPKTYTQSATLKPIIGGKNMSLTPASSLYVIKKNDNVVYALNKKTEETFELYKTLKTSGKEVEVMGGGESNMGLIKRGDQFIKMPNYGSKPSDLILNEERLEVLFKLPENMRKYFVFAIYKDNKTNKYFPSGAQYTNEGESDSKNSIEKSAYIEGGNLDDGNDDFDDLPPDEKKKHIKEFIEGVKALHNIGYMHGDIMNNIRNLMFDKKLNCIRAIDFYPSKLSPSTREDYKGGNCDEMDYKELEKKLVEGIL